MTETLRAQLAAHLRPLLPKAWKIIPYQDSLDTLSTVVVMLSQKTIEHSPALPNGAHLVTFTVTVIDPSQDPKVSEDRLDDEVHALLYALDQLPALAWDRAEKVQFSDTHTAWDISLTVTTTKDVS